MLLHLSVFFFFFLLLFVFLLHWDFTVFCLWIFGVSKPVVLDVFCIQIKFVLLTSLIFRHSLSLKILCLYILNTFGIGLCVAFYSALISLFISVHSPLTIACVCLCARHKRYNERIHWRTQKAIPLFHLWKSTLKKYRFKNGRWIDVGKGWNFSFLRKFLFYWKSVDKSIL